MRRTIQVRRGTRRLPGRVVWTDISGGVRARAPRPFIHGYVWCDGMLEGRAYTLGDIHQPLHISFEDDRGANEVGISGGLCSWDLHAVWDRCIIEQGLRGDPYTLARQLLGEVTDDDRATWRASGPINWANESFAISISPAGGYCVRTESGCWYDADNERLPERTVTVDQAYIEEAHTPTVREQLVKDGVRLAGLLDRALGN